MSRTESTSVSLKDTELCRTYFYPPLYQLSDDGHMSTGRFPYEVSKHFMTTIPSNARVPVQGVIFIYSLDVLSTMGNHERGKRTLDVIKGR